MLQWLLQKVAKYSVDVGMGECVLICLCCIPHGGLWRTFPMILFHLGSGVALVGMGKASLIQQKALEYAASLICLYTNQEEHL